MDGLKLPERPRALVSQASTALDSVEDLLEALFEISRLDAGAIQPEIGDHSLGAILHALRVEFAPLAAAGKLEFDVVETPAWVRSDARLLRRVLQNFVSNAIRYTEAGRVAVEVDEIQGMIRVTVRDTGPGIAASDRDRVFHPFYTTREGGTGLGLALAHKIVEDHGGSIGFRSAEGRGTTFTIVLPLVAEPPAGADRREEPRR